MRIMFELFVIHSNGKNFLQTFQLLILIGFKHCW